MKTTIPKLSKLIKDHKFDWVNSDITDNLFPEPETISSDFKLYHFNRYISSEDAIKEMESDGYRPANAWELLSWKEWNKTDLVVALGSVGEVDGCRRVLYLSRGVSGRGLSLDWWDGGWTARCRFLGVRNLSSDTRASESSPSDTLTLEAAIAKVKSEGYKVIKEY